MSTRIEITEQLLTAYAEGKVTPEERISVRNYLARHPEQLESVLYMMDCFDVLPSDCNISDSNGNIQENMTDGISALFPEISMCAAAFAPPVIGRGKSCCRIADTPEHDDNRTSFIDRLNSLLED